jgi:CHAT domain-containing protein
MKLSRSFSAIFLVVVCIIFLSKSVQAQLGNQSDITNPDVQEVSIPNNSSGNQSDVTTFDIPELTPNTPENPPIPPNSPEDPPLFPNPTSSLAGVTVNRELFDNNFEAATPDEAVAQVEELQALEYSVQLNTNLFGEISSSEDIADTLNNLAVLTGKKTAVIYVTSLQDKLSLIMIPPIPKGENLEKNAKNQNNSQILSDNNPTKGGKIFRTYVIEANQVNIQKFAKEFRSQVTNSRSKDYVNSAKQLYDWMIKPLEVDLQANKIDTLIFSMDSELRSIPIAALYDGEQFLIEKYSVGIIPSFNLTDTRYVPIVKSDILAVGISQSTEDQDPLPSVPLEIDVVSKQIWGSQTQTLLNEESTIEKITSLSSQQNFGIIHLATHGDFQPGKISNSYIQLWNKKLNIDNLRKLSRELKWNQAPKVEMLVLSACRTALGNPEAELGFSGLALQAGVKSVLGSLWYVSDQGSLALMTKFYEQLKLNSLRSESLRQAQLGLLTGKVRIADKYLYLSPEKRIPLSPELRNLDSINLSHPYYWSAFTMIGNWS